MKFLIKKIERLIIAGSFFAFIFNSLYVSYPDEFVNLLGGRSILNGGIPYKDFFDHHLPFAWYLSSIFLLFTQNSYVLFRLLWSLFIFFLIFILGQYIKKNRENFYPYYLLFLILYPITALYFWFHLYLADSLAVLFFLLIFWLLLIETFSEKSNFKIQVLSSLLTFCLIFSSMTFIYLALFLYLWQFYLVISHHKKQWLKFILFSSVPYFVYVLYLIITNSWRDFYFANFYYNTNLYISIPNYVRGRFFNPLKFALTLIDNFYQGYLPLLSKIKHLDLYLPIDTLSALGSLSLLLILFSKNPLFGIFYFFILSFSAPRSNIGQYRETDYQSSMFFVLGTISSLFSFYWMKGYSFKEKIFDDLKRIVHSILTIFLIFSLIFLLGNFYHKFFMVYTQQMPRIRNQWNVYSFLKEVINNNDRFWIGPYEPDFQFFSRELATNWKYPTLLPQFRENDYLKKDFLHQFEENKPTVIIFKHEASIFMTPADQFGRFFLEWLKKDYLNLEEIGNIQILRSPSEFNLKTDFYFLKNKKETILNNLRTKGFIQ